MWWPRYKAKAGQNLGCFPTAHGCSVQCSHEQDKLLSPYSLSGSVDSLGNETEAAGALAELMLGGAHTSTSIIDGHQVLSEPAYLAALSVRDWPQDGAHVCCSD